MRASKYDKYICIVSLVVFLYSFFFIGGKPVYESERRDMVDPWDRNVFLLDDGHDEVVGIRYPSSISLAPLVCMFFLFLIVFERQLRPVNRHWVKKKVKAGWRRFLKKN